MKKGNLENHYARLGVSYDATPEEIKRAFHRAAKDVHPDTSTSKSGATQFLLLKEAFDILSNAKARANYDQSLHAAHQTTGLQLQTLLSRTRLVRTREPQLLYAMVRVAPADVIESEKPSINVCLVVDKSTSMHGKRMDMVKVTSRRILQQLNQGDFFSVVTFSDRAEVVVEPARDLDQKKMDARISLIQTGGGTEMFHGLNLGYQLIMRNHRTTNINHIILITDGQTYGDESKCLDLARQIKGQGITISAIGIGKEWNEHFLDNLAARTGGTSVYVSRAHDLKSFLELKFNALHESYAENIRMQVTNTDTDARLRYVFRVRPEPNRLDTEGAIALGNIGQREPLVFLLEILVPNAEEYEGVKSVMRCEIRYNLSGKDVPAAIHLFDIRLPISVENIQESPPPEIIQAMSRLTLYRMQEQARMEVDNGDVAAATRRLKYLATNVSESGDHDLASTILEEAERLEGGKAHLSGLEKSIMYGTKALITEKLGNTGTSDSPDLPG